MGKRNPRKSASRKSGAQPSRRGAVYNAGDPGSQWLYGYHTVAAALANPKRRPERLIATRAAAERLVELHPGAAPEIVERAVIEEILPEGAVHQGVALRTPHLPEVALEDILAALPPGPAAVLVLDQVTDPQNVGAILRSAAAFGAAAVVVQDRHAPPASAALAKAASGALEIVPLARVVNLARALDLLKSSGFWCVGLAGEASSTLAETPLDDRIVLVMGAEDSGLRRLTLETCDSTARLPTGGAFATLNVSTAAAVALYEVARRRKAP